jgi:hypothetical protein
LYLKKILKYKSKSLYIYAQSNKLRTIYLIIEKNHIQ